MSKIYTMVVATMLLGACTDNSLDREDRPVVPASGPSAGQDTGAEAQSAPKSASEAEAGTIDRAIDFVGWTADKALDFDRFDLKSYSHSAMVLIVRCDDPPGDPTHCDEMFSPTQEYIHIPVVPHCGAGSRFDCSNGKSSFVKHKHDRYVTGLEVRSGSFLEDERVSTGERAARVITAAHTLDRNRLHHTYAIMNLAQSGFAWPVGEGGDHMGIEPRFVLRVSKVVNCEDTSRVPDWAVLEVEPILLDSQGIPEHDAFELATYEPRLGARITVPAHPRGLPLKLADGVITSEIGSSEGLRGIFDVAGGSSGSPVLDEQGRIVGINRVQAKLIHGHNGLADLTCEFPSTDNRCQGQPLTPATRIAEHLSRPPEPGDCSLVQ